MKRRILQTLIVGAAVACAAAASAVPILTVGDVAFKFNDFTFFDQPANFPGGAPIPTGGTGSGRSWGVANVTSIHTVLSGGIDAPTLLSPVPIWTATATDLLQVRFGGLILDQTHAGFPPIAFPYDLYFDTDPTAAYTKAGAAYMEIYSRTSDGFAADYVAGPGAGTYGSFGANVAGAGGSLWLDIALTPGILQNYDVAAEGPLAGGIFPAVAPPPADWDVEKSTVSALTTAAATMYGDVVGGTAASTFVDGAFPVGGFLGQAFPIHADIRFISNLTALFNPQTNAWTDEFGWTNASQDPVTGRVSGVVPEPGTMVLVGTGLLGIASAIRRKKKV